MKAVWALLVLAAGMPVTACREGQGAYHDTPSRADTKSYRTLTLANAKRMMAAAEDTAAKIGIPYNIAAVDAGGNLVDFVRQDGALIGAIDIAIHKAITARMFDNPTALLGQLAVPGKPYYGIQQSNGGNVVILGGGIPIRVDGTVVGAVGASAGTAEQTSRSWTPPPRR